MRPVAEFQFMDFIGCAFNQISNMVAKTHYLWGAPAPLVLRGPSGGYVHGGPFHSQNPEMWFVHNPGPQSNLPGHALRRQRTDQSVRSATTIPASSSSTNISTAALRARFLRKTTLSRIGKARVAAKAATQHHHLRRHGLTRLSRPPRFLRKTESMSKS
jgi:hypothetical protein